MKKASVEYRAMGTGQFILTIAPIFIILLLALALLLAILIGSIMVVGIGVTVIAGMISTWVAPTNIKFFVVGLVTLIVFWGVLWAGWRLRER